MPETRCGTDRPRLRHLSSYYPPSTWFFERAELRDKRAFCAVAGAARRSPYYCLSVVLSPFCRLSIPQPGPSYHLYPQHTITLPLPLPFLPFVAFYNITLWRPLFILRHFFDVRGALHTLLACAALYYAPSTAAFATTRCSTYFRPFKAPSDLL